MGMPASTSLGAWTSGLAVQQLGHALLRAWLLRYVLSPLLLSPFLLQAAPAYSKLRVERMNVRLAGIRAKRAKEAEAEKNS